MEGKKTGTPFWRLGGAGTLVAATICLYCLFYIAPLGLRPLFVPDESRYGEIAREMVDDGDWLELRQAGLPYYEKPPLGYWLNALSMSVFGRTGFALRLPSALSAGLTALAVFYLALRYRQDGRRALLAAIVYLSCVQVFGMATFAVLDSMFVLFVCLSMVLFHLATERAGGTKTALLALAGVACGAAFLTKGFTALVIPALTAALWFPWERRFRELLSVWIVPVAVAGVFVLPFALAVHRANPDFWNYFFWVEHVQRFLDPQGGQHRQAFWFYLPVLAISAIPWTFFIYPIFTVTRRLAATDRLTRYCVCWFGASFLFFSACGGKLPTYLLPCFPPLAIMIADAVFECASAVQLKRAATIGAAALAAALVGFLCWLVLSDDDPTLRAHLFADGKTILLGLAALAGAFCLHRAGKWFMQPNGRMRAAALVGISLGGMFAASFLFLPAAVENQRSPSRLLDQVVGLTPESAFLVADRITLPSVCWHYEREDVVFFGSPGELEYGLDLSRENGRRHVESADKAAALIRRALEKGRPVAVIVQESAQAQLDKAMRGTEPDDIRNLERYVWTLYSDRNNETASRALVR